MLGVGLPPAFMRAFSNANVNAATSSQQSNPPASNGAVPPPQIATRPGPSDWAQIGSSIYDGDYVVLRNNAWKGCTIYHSTGAQEVRGEKKSGGDVSVSRIDNQYAWCIRKVIFDADVKAFVLPTLEILPRRQPILKSDFVVFIAPNNPDLVMGTQKPQPFGNNGDYRVQLIHFPLVTANQLTNYGVTEKFKRFISFGLWNNEKKQIDFLAQALGVWTFHAIGVDNQPQIVYGSKPLNIRNVWTEFKSKEASIWDSRNPIALIVQSTFHGGRNLTMAAGSNGQTVKLALSNKDSDDKAGWIIDGWHGNHYPVQRVLAPVQQPPPPPQVAPGVPAPQQPIPNLTEMIQKPPPIDIPGLTYDPQTGVNRPTTLESKTQDQQRRTWLERMVYRILGVYWDDMSYLQQILTLGVVFVLLPLLIGFLVKIIALF